MITWVTVVLFVFTVVLSVWTILLLFTVVALIRSRGVPYVPINKMVVEVIVKNIKLNKNDYVADLGCGDGKILRLFERQGLTSLDGYEYNLWAYLKACYFNWRKHLRVKIYFKNFNKINLRKYNVVYCYLLPHVMQRLKTKFDRELRPGTKVISACFEIKDWKQPQNVFVFDCQQPKINQVFIYQI